MGLTKLITDNAIRCYSCENKATKSEEEREILPNLQASLSELL